MVEGLTWPREKDAAKTREVRESEGLAVPVLSHRLAVNWKVKVITLVT